MTDEEKIAILSAKVSAPRLQKMLAALENRTRKITVVLEDVYQPHNAAAVLRNCDAFGINDAHFIENKYLSRISDEVDTGVSKWMQLYRYVSPIAKISKLGMPKVYQISDVEKQNTADALTAIKAQGYSLVASTLRPEAGSIEKIPVDRPIALMIGTELTGLTDIAHDMADFTYTTPMMGFAQSFNLSVFSALSLSNLSSRMRALDDSWRLDESQKRELLLRWLTTSVGNAQAVLSQG